MPEDFWDDDFILIDMLFESNKPLKDIAATLGITEYQLNKKIRELGLSWVKRKSPKVSRGQASLTAIMQKLIPGEAIVPEYGIDNRLRLDVYCPRLKIGAEYHGRQHFFYVEHFHKNLDGFKESQRRDEEKEQYCKDNGIGLIVFRYNDELNEDTVYERILAAIAESEPAKIEKEKKRSFKDHPYYEVAKKRRNDYQREQYKKMKAQRSTVKRK